MPIKKNHYLPITSRVCCRLKKKVGSLRVDTIAFAIFYIILMNKMLYSYYNKCYLRYEYELILRNYETTRNYK